MWSAWNGSETLMRSKSTTSARGPSSSRIGRFVRCHRNLRKPRRCPTVSIQLTTPGFWSLMTRRILPSGSTCD
ncbi:Uncharacterised protein [Mycobacteroides abscessus subsp. abscessus]|nr:Uncharacterised protein [Mycobacteroides abscessus subsp. abscessus]